ncbi:MAG: SufD family Fe-S cluster assembly protein [Rhodobacteraceae bacterium]|nr:SufD family Fe-S cluster assembly protein [Paracoccaceae bacterium]
MGALSQIKADLLAARVAGRALPAGFDAARQDARARLQAMGLPVKRDEYWRYTDPSGLTGAVLPAAPVVDDPPFGEVEKITLVFVDGVFDAGASQLPATPGLDITRLSQAGADHWAAAQYGVLEARGQTPVARPLAAHNTAYATDGVLIRVTGAVDLPVALVYRQTSDQADVVLHHLVDLAPGAALTLIESGTAGARFSQVLEVSVADGARFDHIRLQGPGSDRQANTHLFARLGQESRLKSFTLSADGRLTRNEAVLELAGDHGAAHVAGATFAGPGCLHDDTVFITHAGLACESRQVFKKVLSGDATGVFQGKILVKPGAQKTDGYQISQSLLLDEISQFLAKPELEIYADDVKCSHGSTSGAIDETALFYLRSRGVPQAAARGLLILAFLAEALAEIDNPALSDAVLAQMDDWLAGFLAR